MCRFCEGNKSIVLSNGLEITLDEDKLDLEYYFCRCGSFADELKINYCPMCGKKLGNNND